MNLPEFFEHINKSVFEELVNIIYLKFQKAIF